MADTFNIASSLSNRLGEDRYYAALDFDGAKLLDIESEVKSLQAEFGLSDAWLYRTKNGFHAHFFNDNRLTHGGFTKVLAASKLVDPRFRESFAREQEGGKRITIRAAGKYAERDVRFFKVLPGLREPAFADLNMGKSLKLMYDSMVESPVFDHSKFAVAVSEEPGSEPIVEKAAAGSSAAPSNDEFFAQDGGMDARTVESVRPDYRAVGRQLTKWWYQGPLGKQIGRLVSAASAGCELAFVVPPDLRGIKGHDGLLTTRPFFFDNHKAPALMLAPYKYAVEHGKLETTPLNFFMSHARFDLSKLVGKAAFHDFKGRRALGDDMSEKFSEYVTGFDLIFDVDSKDPDASESWEESRKLRDALRKRGLPFSMLFSGSKGFHFRIHADDLNRAAPFWLESVKKDPAGAVERAHKGLLRFAENAGAKVDEKAYNGVHRAIIRVPWSVHQATGAVAKPLTDVEFDSLAGKTLRQVQGMMFPENLVEGNKALGVRKLELQRNEFEIRAEVAGEWVTWEEMRDSGTLEKETDVLSADGKRKIKEWEKIRAEKTNPALKELRRLNADDKAGLAKALASGELLGCRVGPGEWIDLTTGWNWDYRRPGSDEALRAFVLEITN